MTIHTEPTVHGMGAFEGGHLPGELIRAARVRSARMALADLDGRTFADLVVEAIRNRPAVLADSIIDRVTK